MAKKLMFSFITLLISFVILIIGGEILARLLVKEKYILDEMNLTYRHDEELGWFPVENSSKQFKGTRLINVKHNKNGFRDIDHDSKKKKRIAFIGDSFVWGYDVDYGERFTEYLQNRLPEWEIINMGISGYSNDQELILIQKWFNYFKPDIVFLVICDNDMVGNRRNNLYNYYKPYFTYTENKLVKHGTPVSKSLPYYTGKYPNLLKSRLVQGIIQVTRQKYIIVEEDPTIEIINEMDVFVKSKGARFFIAFTDDDETKEECSYCESSNIPYLLLTNNYRYDTNGYHWTPEGNNFVSTKIYQFLKEQKVLTD